MSQRRIDQLPWPPRKYRIDKHSKSFETKRRAIDEDAHRARCLRRTAKKVGGKLGKRMRQLAKRLDPSLTRKPETLASSRYMRSQRIRIIGNLRRLAKADRKTLRAFTIVRENWSFDANELSTVDPASVLDAFRKQLDGNGAAQASGWLFAAYHGEYDPTTGRFQGHLHGFATEQMVDIVDRLRTLKGYQSSRRTGKNSTVVDPVHVSRNPITRPFHTLSYAVKSYWPEYRQGPTCSRKVRLHEPLHSHWLLWLDEHALGDLILLRKLSIRRNGLMPK